MPSIELTHGDITTEQEKFDEIIVSENQNNENLDQTRDLELDNPI